MSPKLEADGLVSGTTGGFEGYETEASAAGGAVFNQGMGMSARFQRPFSSPS